MCCFLGVVCLLDRLFAYVSACLSVLSECVEGVVASVRVWLRVFVCCLRVCVIACVCARFV